jgi:hypothetical protein
MRTVTRRALGSFVIAFLATAALLALLLLDHFDRDYAPPAAPLPDQLAERWVWLSSYGISYGCSVEGFGPDGPVPAAAAVEGVDGVIRLEPFDEAWADYLAGSPDGETLIAVCLHNPEGTP